MSYKIFCSDQDKADLRNWALTGEPLLHAVRCAGSRIVFNPATGMYMLLAPDQPQQKELDL